MKLITICVWLFAGFSSFIYGQSKSDKCTVSATWWDHERGIGSRVHVLDLFEVAETQESVVRSTRDENRDIFVIAGINYHRSSDLKRDPLYITLAIRTSDQDSQDVFHYLENASESVFLSADPKWIRFSVSTHIKEKEHIIKYTLTCQNGDAEIHPKK